MITFGRRHADCRVYVVHTGRFGRWSESLPFTTRLAAERLALVMTLSGADNARVVAVYPWQLTGGPTRTTEHTRGRA